MVLRPSDELDHLAGPSSAWSETWEFRATTPDAALAVMVAVVRRPAVGQMSYSAAVLGRSRPTIAMVDHDIAAPRVGLELRATSLWADHVCEDPHQRWSLGLEAFALALDEPWDLIATGRGLPVPLGFDLEWETPDPPIPIESPVDMGYLAAGEAHGEVLVGDQALTLEGPGHRLHRWGNGATFGEWWAAGHTAGTGRAPWALAELSTAYVIDTFDVVTKVSIGRVLADDGPEGPGWRSGHLAAPER